MSTTEAPNMLFDGRAELWRAGGLAPLKLRNRVMRSATWEGLADERGFMTPVLADTMGALARGGVALVTFSHTMVAPLGQAGPRQLAIYTDEQADSMRGAVDQVHAAGSLCALQLNHAGRFAIVEPRMGASDVELKTAAGVALYPCHAATADELDAVVEAFRAAAVRATKSVPTPCIAVYTMVGARPSATILAVKSGVVHSRRVASAT